MLENTITLRSLVFVLSASILISCGGKQENKKEKLTAEDVELIEKIEKVVYEIPSPSEIPYLIESTGAEFDGSLIHPTNKVGQYLTSNKAALNLGVYATDIGYLSSYSKVQDALDYLGKIKPLVEQLGLMGSFDPKMMERFEKNLSSKDSLSTIINEAVAKADKHLKNNERNNTAALILAGSFVEGLNIACALVENYPDDILPEDQKNLILVPIVRVILLQEQPLEDLIALLRSINPDEYTQQLIEILTVLSGEYKKLNIQDNINSNRGDLLLKNETLDAITNQVGKIRDFITH